jgi:hypothetical protein
VTLGADGRIVNDGNNKLTFAIAKPNGIFKGTFLAPGTTKPLPVQGVLFQKQNNGYGYFFGETLSGSVTVSGN